MKWIPPILIGSCLACSHSTLEANLPSLLSVGVGSFDTFRSKKLMQFQVEYLWSACWYGLRPVASVMATHKGSLYVCFGAAYEMLLGNRVVLTPSFAPGFYMKNKGTNLGFPLEFRSAISLSYIRSYCDRIGIQFYHLSNAGIGKKNPGEESLVLYYGIAF